MDHVKPAFPPHTWSSGLLGWAIETRLHGGRFSPPLRTTGMTVTPAPHQEHMIVCRWHSRDNALDVALPPARKAIERDARVAAFPGIYGGHLRVG